MFFFPENVFVWRMIGKLFSCQNLDLSDFYRDFALAREIIHNHENLPDHEDFISVSMVSHLRHLIKTDFEKS